MKEMQFTAVVLTLVMAMILMTMLPTEVKNDRVANRSRWWMAGGLLLLSVQFLLQYILGLREEGVAQAVMLNLLFFVPSSMLVSMSVLNLQQQGHTERRDWAVGWTVTACIFIVFAIYAVLVESRVTAVSLNTVLGIEVVASIIYATMQIYYSVHIGRQLRRMEAALANYYDVEQPALLRWMKVSIGILLLLALTVPGAIFTSGLPLALYGVFFIVAIVYLWFSLVRYIITAEGRRMKDADDSEEKDTADSDKEDGKAAVKSEQVEQWVAAKGYLKHGLTKPIAANEMHLSEQQLSAWIKASGYKSFTQWMTMLRIDEATRQLEEYADYSISNIADACGIDRSHFHRLFGEH